MKRSGRARFSLPAGRPRKGRHGIMFDLQARRSTEPEGGRYV
jgi:hypothetical protein